ncbi:MAG: hypothetical protein KAS30_05295, partial [Candidatus Diapherotrites archaeon]|nr:hypothetical protein [Candidatus Diapherotrites archaeon]
MIPEKAKKVRVLFLIIYMVFAAMLVYLFMFNSGLAITEEFDQEAKEKVVYVENTTERIINNVKVSYKISKKSEEIKLMDFNALYPGQKREVNFEGVKSTQIILIVDSLFHLTVEKPIVLQEIKSGGDITINLDFPSNVLFGKSFDFGLEACNKYEEEQKIRVEETH